VTKKANKPIRWFGNALRSAGTRIARRFGSTEIWIDIGAHHGESSLPNAKNNPGLKVYAVEPNLRAASKLVGRLANYVVLPMAIAEKDGSADFYVSVYDHASSLLPFNEEGLRTWAGHDLKIDSVVTVPTIRLDTLMGMLEIEKVDFLKIDTQGMDLAVLRSAGTRLGDIGMIRLEVWVAPVPLYSGAPSKQEVVAFLEGSGFSLVETEKQTDGQEENLTFVRTDLAAKLARSKRRQFVDTESSEPARV
jgi:FkbM family methyltransferase